jgi:beta-lactamase regulating signal transducer with metallopeptidase domain
MSRWPESLVLWLADYYVLATVLLAAAFACLSFVRQPARRLAVAWAALASLLVLALLTALPGWPRLAINPPTPTAPIDNATESELLSVVAPTAEQLNKTRDGTSTTASTYHVTLSHSELQGLFKSQRPKAISRVGLLSTETRKAETRTQEKARAQRAEPAPGERNWLAAWAGVIVGLFISGSLLALAWLGLGAIQVRRLCRRARPAPAALQALLARLAGQPRRMPRLLLSPRVGQPVALGVFRPTILLPAQAVETVAEEQLAAVLAHEWAHICRGDLWLLALARWLLVLLFAHPLYWWLRGRLRLDQETLADADAAGPEGAIDYAATLLHWVRLGRRRRGAEASLALWGRPSELKRRVLMLLDPKIALEARCPGRWRWRAWTLTGVCALGLSAITLRPVPAATTPEPQNKPTPDVKKDTPRKRAAPTNETPKKNPQTAPKKVDALAKFTWKVAGRVENQDRKRLARAQVAVFAWQVKRGTAAQPEVLARTRTDDKGQYQVQVRHPGPHDQLAALATAPGYGLGWQFLQPKSVAVIRLQSEQIIRGRLIDLEGQAAPGVKVSVCRVGTQHAGDGGWYDLAFTESADAAGDPAPQIRLYPANGQTMSTNAKGQAAQSLALRFGEPPANLPPWPGAVTTDSRGRFTLRGIGQNHGVGLQVRDPRYAIQTLDLKPQSNEKSTAVTLALSPARTLVGKVFDADTGKPLPGARLHIPAQGSGFSTLALAVADAAETDWKGRRRNGPANLDMFLNLTGLLPDPLPALDVRADKEGRYKLPLFLADSYTVHVFGPPSEPYLPVTRTVSWPKAGARKELNLPLPRGVRVKAEVKETPSGKAVPGAHIDFWAPGLKLPEGVRFPRSLKTGADGGFETVLPPAAWHLLVNASSGVYLHQRIAAAQLIGKKPTEVLTAPGTVATVDPRDKKLYFYPDAWVALSLKPRADTQKAVIQLRREAVRGRVVRPDGKPVAEAVLFYRHPVPSVPMADVRTAATADAVLVNVLDNILSKAKAQRGSVVAPVPVRGGNFEIAMRDMEASYHLHFLDAKNKLGAVAELSGALAKKKAMTVRLAACGSIRARLVDVKGKPKAKYQPQVWMVVPPEPFPLRDDLAAWSSSTAVRDTVRMDGTARLKKEVKPSPRLNYDRIWLGYADPLHYGKGFMTDARGDITLPALIPGATYRILNVNGKAKDFKVESGKTLDAGKLVIQEPVRKTQVMQPSGLAFVEID